MSDAPKLAALVSFNGNYVRGVIDWLQQLLAWLNSYHPDWDQVKTDATALLKTATDALADGRLTFKEVLAILNGVQKLVSDLCKMQG